MIKLAITGKFLRQLRKLIEAQTEQLSDLEGTGVTDEFDAASHAHLINNALRGLREGTDLLMANTPTGSVEIASDEADMLSEAHAFAEAFDNCEELIRAVYKREVEMAS